MNLSDLIRQYGDDKVIFQKLDDSAVSLNMSRGETTITFMTHEPLTLYGGTDRLGLVIWLDRKRTAQIIAEDKAGTPPPQNHFQAIANAARAYVDSVSGEPKKDCWDTEDGKEAPGATRFASDWAWQEYDVKKQKAFDALCIALTMEVPNNG